MSKKMYVIADGEDVFLGFPDDQAFNQDGGSALTTLSEARTALRRWNKELGYDAEDDCPSPLEIYELKKVK